VRERIIERDVELAELGVRAGEVQDQIISANAYTGADEILALLEQDARFVLGGRLADPSLYVAGICHELGWASDDWDKIALATLAAHLLECGTHVTGGNYADPPYRPVDGIERLGFPYAILSGDEVTMTKLDGTGGAVTSDMAKAQLGYEIHDPARYVTPDVVANFSQCYVEQAGPDRVVAGGATGSARPDTLKVLVGLDLGWKAIGEMSFGGTGCVDRARIGIDMVKARVEPLMGDIDDIHYALHGMTALFGDQVPRDEPAEVRLRIAVRSRRLDVARAVADEAEHLWANGPAGAGGATTRLDRAIGVTPAYLSRTDVNITGEVVVS